MNLQVTVPDFAFEDLWHAAARSGYMRENPRKAWTQAEKKLAIRWLLNQEINRLVQDCIR